MANDVDNKRVLVFSPHPDDADITLGGTMCRLLADGWEVILADITNGEPTPAGNPEMRAAEAAQAGKVLGLTERLCLGLPNRYLDESLEYRRPIAETVRQYRPRWLFTTFPTDAHPDHIHASRLVDDARFTAKLTKTDMKFEPFYPDKIIYYYASHLRLHPEPSFVVDISEFWDQKIEAISAFQSQFWLNQTDPSRKGWILEHISTICRYFGNRIGVEYAEPFYCHELVGLSNLDSLL